MKGWRKISLARSFLYYFVLKRLHLKGSKILVDMPDVEQAIRKVGKWQILFVNRSTNNDYDGSYFRRMSDQRSIATYYAKSTILYEIPSYCVYSDWTYPAAYPAHLNPPAQVHLGTNNGQQFPLRPNQLAQVNADMALCNGQKSPIQIDMRDIADEIRAIRWNC